MSQRWNDKEVEEAPKLFSIRILSIRAWNGTAETLLKMGKLLSEGLLEICAIPKNLGSLTNHHLKEMKRLRITEASFDGSPSDPLAAQAVVRIENIAERMEEKRQAELNRPRVRPSSQRRDEITRRLTEFFQEGKVAAVDLRDVFEQHHRVAVLICGEENREKALELAIAAFSEYDDTAMATEA